MPASDQCACYSGLAPTAGAACANGHPKATGKLMRGRQRIHHLIADAAASSRLSWRCQNSLLSIYCAVMDLSLLSAAAPCLDWPRHLSLLSLAVQSEGVHVSNLI